MREELSELIRYEIADPRLSSVDVTEVIVTQDLKRAEVLVTLPPSEEEREGALAGLESARGYLRAQLMLRLDLYRMPELRFRAALEASSGQPLGRLLRRARRGRPRTEATNPEK
jgi:ribosome-binding factor A